MVLHGWTRRWALPVVLGTLVGFNALMIALALRGPVAPLFVGWAVGDFILGLLALELTDPPHPHDPPR